MKRIKLVVFFILGLFMLTSCSMFSHESFPSGPQIEEPGTNPDVEVSSYLITYYENGLKIHQESLESGKALPQVESTKAPLGQEFMGWSTSKEEYVPVDFDVMPESDVDLYAFYQNVKYTITFNANINLPDGTTTTKEYEYHERLSEFVPSDLQEIIDAQTDYVFVGWFLDPEFKEEFVEVSMPAEDIVLYAKWQFSGIRFMNGLEVFYEVKDDEGAAVQAPLQNPTKPGYDFVGWVDAKGNAVSFPLIVTDEVQFIYAAFEAKNNITYKVEHYLENLNGTFVRQEVEELFGSTDSEVEALWKSYTGFSKDETNENNVLKGIVNYNGTLVLKLYYSRNSYKVSFETNGGSAIQAVSYKYEQMVAAPSSPNKLGYTFAGWELNGESYSFTNMPAHDIELNAKWQVVEYTVTFVATELVGKVTYTVENKNITEPAVPAVEHFTGAWEEYELTTGNITVKAVYTPVTYTVTFKAEGVTVDTENYTVVNPTITEPSVPAKEHYTGAWESYVLVGGNVEVEAVYTPVTYYVKFVAEGTEVAKLPYTVENKAVVNPAVPAKAHYTGVWESYTLTSGNVEVEAVYTPVTYYVTFVAEGTEVAKIPYTVENKAVVNPAVPAKAHYTGVWESYTLTSGNVEVEAVYTPVTYYVTFVAEGTEVAKLPYTVENKAVVNPAVPAKAHYTGVWETYTLTSGNVEVEAIYTPVTYTVTFKDGESVIGSDAYTIVDTIITEPALPTKAHYTSAWATYVLDGGNKEVQVVYTPVTYYVTFVAEGTEIAKLPYTVENTAIVEPAVPTKEHYSAAWESYSVVNGNITVNAVYTAITYYVTFVAEGSVVAKLPYTIVNNTVEEPAVPTKAGYTGSWFTYELNGGNKEVQAAYELVDYTINYNTNDGALVMDAIIADFLNDYNTARGKSHTVESFVALGSMSQISDASLFLYNAQYKAKWSWLVNYIASVASAANKPAYDVFFDFNSQSELNAANSNHIYRIAYELRGWVGQTQYTKNANFKTADYSTRSVQLKAFEYYYSNSYNIESETINLYSLYKPGHTFEGWYNNPEFTGSAITSIPSGSYGDINLYAKFVELPKYQLNMNLNEGELDDSYYGVYSIGDPQVSLDISTYDNSGNASGTYLCDKSIVPNNSLRWQYKILLQYDASLDAYKVVCLDAAKDTANNAASAAGVTWTHALSNSSSNITTLVTLGQYIVLSQKATVGTNDFEAFVYEEPQLIYGVKPIIYTIESEDITLPTPTKEGYTFAGWYNNPEFTGEKVTVVDTAINSNVTVYAKWSQDVSTIIFNTNGGTAIESITAPVGDTITKPADPTKEGYTFAGWDQEIPSVMPSSGLTINATWTINQYTITFDTDGGSTIDSITVDYNSEVVAPENPTKVGYNFLGWDQEIPSKMPANNTTIKAKWELITYTITYDVDGTLSQLVSMDDIIQEFINDYNTSRGTSHTVESFYEIGEWTEIGAASTFLYSSEYRAKWAWLVNYITSVASSANKPAYEVFFDYTSQSELNAANSNHIYRIAYELRAWVGQAQYTKNANFKTADYSTAEVQNAAYKYMFPTEYTVNNEGIRLFDINHDDLLFKGWYTTPDFSGEAITMISKGTTGNITLYARLVEPITEVELSAGDIAALNGLGTTPSIIVSNQFKKGTYIVDGKNYKLGDDCFGSLAEALAAAQDGDTIYVFAGDYPEAITSNAKNLTIVGPNYNIKGAANRPNAEANITGLTTINGENTTINGLAFSGNGAIKVGANNVTITNIKTTASQTACNGQNRKGCIVDSANISDLTVSNSYIDAPGTYNSYTTQYMSFNNVTNLTIENNIITNTKATTISGSGSYAGMRIYTANGTLNIKNNEFRWATNGYVMIIATNNCSEVNIVDNLFDGTETIKNNATISIRNGKAGNTINIIHNYFYNFKGSTFTFDSNNATPNILYNYLASTTSHKVGTKGNVDAYYEGNYYEAAQTTETSDYNIIKSLAEMEEAYRIWLLPSESLTLNANGGSLSSNPTSYKVGLEVDLPTPTKEHYIFGGWYTNPEFTGEAMYKILESTSGVLNLYAKWTPVEYTVTFKSEVAEDIVKTYTVDNTTIEEPTVPTKVGYTGVWESYTLTSGNVEVNAVYTINQYKVTFMNGSDVLSEETLDYGTTINAIANPTKDGYEFVGWSIDLPNTVPAEDLVINALWKSWTYTYTFGANGSASHYDGSEINTTNEYASLEDANIKLSFSSLTKVYGGARDAQGNSALKLGTSKIAGAFTFAVDDDVKYIVIYVAQYKDDATTVTINGTKYTITTASDNGEYTSIIIDTTSTKEINFAVSSGYRCMIDKIFMSRKELQKATISFDSNGADGSMTDIVDILNTEIVLPSLSGIVIPTNKKFDCWNTSPDGSGTSYKIGDTITLSSDFTLYAIWSDNIPTEMTISEALTQEDGINVIIEGVVDSIDYAWNESYGNMSVTIKDETGSIYAYRLATQVTLGDLVRITGQVGSHESSKQLVEGATAEIIGHDTSYDTPEGAQMFDKITDINQLVEGTKIVLVYNKNISMGTQHSKGYRNSVSISDIESATSLDANISVITLEKVGSNWALKVSDGYLALTANDNKLYTVSSSSATTAQWTISINSSGELLIQNMSYTNRYIQYNTSSPRFACYKSTQKNPTGYIYNE